ncbi:MAG: LysR family transcriptional regulator [Phenylobacterium sp.]|nr:LysR family transcriptional regulator [Phenylobacterium sp.]
MRFDLTDLRLFCDVVDEGSITAGAEKSALALAAASTRIRNMEGALGATLLTRSRQGVTATPAGRMLLKHARAMLEQAARMREDLSAFAGGLSCVAAGQHQRVTEFPARGAGRVPGPRAPTSAST